MKGYISPNGIQTLTYAGVTVRIILRKSSVRFIRVVDSYGGYHSFKNMQALRDKFDALADKIESDLCFRMDNW